MDEKKKILLAQERAPPPKESALISVTEFLAAMGVHKDDQENIYERYFASNGINSLSDLESCCRDIPLFEADRKTKGNLDKLGLPLLLEVRIREFLRTKSATIPRFKRSKTFAQPKLVCAAFSGIYSFKERTIFEWIDNKILLVGHNGAGKTNFARGIAKLLEIFFSSNRVELTEEIRHKNADKVWLELIFELDKELKEKLARSLSFTLQSSVSYETALQLKDGEEDNAINYIVSKITFLKVTFDGITLASYITDNGKPFDDDFKGSLGDTIDYNRNSHKVVEMNKQFIETLKDKSFVMQAKSSAETRHWDWLETPSHAPRLIEVFRRLLDGAVVFYGRSNRSPKSMYQFQSTFTMPTIEEILVITNNQALLSNSDVFTKVNDALSTISGYRVFARWGIQSLAEELHNSQINFNDLANAVSLLPEEHFHIKQKWNRLMKKIQKKIITKDTTIKILDHWKQKYADQFKSFLEQLTKKPIDFSLRLLQTDIAFHKETDVDTPVSMETISGGVLDLFIVLFLIYSNEDTSTLILDEPGASLHPPKRAQLREFLFHSSRNIAVITHAPELVSLNVIPFTYYCLNLKDNTKAKRINDLGLDEKDVSMLLEPATRSLLFANKVLFVEGNTEEILIQALYQLYETQNDIDKQEASSITSFTLFRLEGADKFTVIHKCASLLGINHIAILDNDTLHPLHSPNKPHKNTDELKGHINKTLSLLDDMEQNKNVDDDIRKIIKPIKEEQKLALQFLSSTSSNNQSKESKLTAILNPTAWQTYDSEAKREFCRLNGIFVWKSDPETMVSSLPELAATLYLVSHPRERLTSTDTKLQNKAVPWCTQRRSGLKKAWRTMPFVEIVRAVKYLKDKCEDFMAAINFMKSSTGIPHWKDAKSNNNNNII